MKELVIKQIGIAVLGAFIGWAVIVLPVWAETARGAPLFDLHCAGCHANGGNIVRRGKTLKLKALEKNGYGTEAAIAEIVTHGKGNMSAYQERLTPEQIQTVSAYVLEQAHLGWR
ncbi:c-type cytochrome [Myxacorys almedinensis]|uniref:C-type cytochrome n=1 Tax=Myxacorys almedinensis A TaxID=2690445 RepID=A0A8J7Z3A5_9CYAN|nr:c-type cytochrome [Myxacorys almedinensis]NDJ19214.1 c-type cytochrome [Myxacorys almedinensis A]